jgi:hypothetical protein
MNGSSPLESALTALQSLIAGFSLSSFVLGTVAASCLFLWLVWRRQSRIESVSINIPFGLGSATFDLTPVDRVAAWKLHVQLVTRKAALPFDEAHDTIADVLSSLFDVFQVARALLLELPPDDRKRHDDVARLIVRVLNDGLRPMLTRWHADYRHWWKAAVKSPSNATRSPQEIQRDYPRYQELVADLRRMNGELGKFADELAAVASGTRRT